MTCWPRIFVAVMTTQTIQPERQRARPSGPHSTAILVTLCLAAFTISVDDEPSHADAPPVTVALPRAEPQPALVHAG
jgi:hypothetical protein